MNNRITKNDAGERIKQARTMTGSTRKLLYDQFGVNINTLQAWETGRNTISNEAAIRLASIFMTLGIVCSEKWLLTGIGSKPYFLNDQNYQDNGQLGCKENKNELIEEEKILEESILFKNHYKLSKVIIVTEDAMLPFYEIGDYVGGFLYENHDIPSALGYNSIIITSDNETFFRKFIYLSSEGKYLLSAINPEVRSCQPLIYRENIIAVAPIVWHRKIVCSLE